MKVTILNPLAGALAHYTTALCDTLRSCGLDVLVKAVPEPRLDGSSRGGWVVRYACSIGRQARHSADVWLATWPVIGYWDFVMLRALLRGSPVHLVMHDPDPLVYARGYARGAVRLAESRAIGARAIVHSQHGQAAMASTTTIRSSLLPHPMIRPVTARDDAQETVVRVVGQYKPTRNLDALRLVRERCPGNWRYEVVGDGWPNLDGWAVTDRFVSETEFAEAIATASIVLIPYRSFFQSGVAVRCLEQGVPFVGPANSELGQLPLVPSAWLAKSDEAWPDAAVAAASTPAATTHEVALATYDRSLAAWRAWADDTCRYLARSKRIL